MKAIRKLSLFLVLVVALAHLGHAQDPQLSYSFSIYTSSDAGNDVSVFGNIHFGQWENDGIITVDLINLSYPDENEITGFYMLRPTYLDDGEMIGTASDLGSSPAGWDYADYGDVLNPQLANEFQPPPDPANYFGAYNNDSNIWSTSVYPDPTTLQFTFGNETKNTDGTYRDLNLTAWADHVPYPLDDPDDPVVFVRWQSVDSDNELDPNWDSAKGYGYLDPGFNPVPEPSHVAFMAMAGLGGLLWLRKRFQARKRS